MTSHVSHRDNINALRCHFEERLDVVVKKTVFDKHLVSKEMMAILLSILLVVGRGKMSGSQPSVEHAVESIRSIAKASGTLSKTQLRQADAVCECAKKVMWASAMRLVEDASGLPVLTSKSADGTPIRVTNRVRRTTALGSTVRSEGKECHEFLVKHQFFKACLPESGWTTRIVVPEATSLEFGKHTAAILSCAQRDWRSLRQMGHSGVSVEHYVFDRFGFSALERQLRQWHLEQPLP